MRDIFRTLIETLGGQEAAAEGRGFLAPCVPGGILRTRVCGLIKSYRADPESFEGWGHFLPCDDRTAVLDRTADVWDVAEYLNRLASLRVWMVSPLRGQTWLAVPVNASDAIQKTGSSAPIAVRLTEGSAQLDRAVVRFDGASWWFEESDRRGDPIQSERVRALLREGVSTMEDTPGATPELRLAYEMAVDPTGRLPVVQHADRSTGHAGRSRAQVEPDAQGAGWERIQAALLAAGGQLIEARNQGDFWWVEWQTSHGETHHSAIAKTDLTVISAGICLDGGDRDFDLQSLVGVVEGAGSYLYRTH